MKKSLRCGCCGVPFRGIQSPEYDKGFGVCAQCTVEENQRAELMVKQAINELMNSLSPDNQAYIKSLSQEQKEQLAIRAIDEGLLSWTA